MADPPPISNLPVDLLSTILVLSISHHEDSEDLLHSWPEHVELTSVCKIWRQTARECAEFWSYLPFFHLAFSSRFPKILARSKEGPLTLRIGKGLSHTLPPAAHLSLLLNAARLKHVRLNSAEAQLIAHFPDADTPLLAGLVMVNYNGRPFTLPN
ncbi:hypothetical protein BDV98DRAFT_384074 [Pterulicium gracile]|uniref:F-box domain-containing protein n=1 Tax=Pterulicium gracile TaxID=1884261 RepID=A0A5C3QNN0_9AGAR|nr:hypothetical protein BDV98DRAFT_384074 [Pterula gracilis]